MKKLVRNLRALRKRDEGASAVEYGLLVALIAVIIAAAVALLGSALNTKLTDANQCVSSNNPSAGDCNVGGGAGG